MVTICLPDEDAGELVGPLVPSVKTLLWKGQEPAPDEAGTIEFLVPRYDLGSWTPEALSTLPGLRVIQLLTAGVEAWTDRVPSGVTLCSGRGIHTASTAELALAGTLALLHELPQFGASQATQAWDRHSTDALWGKRVLVVGAGDIGQRYARAVEVFEASATFVGRTAREGVHAVGELPRLAPQHDIVLISVPHTSETHHLVDEAFLAALPDGALVVNIARGAIVDTDALVVHLAKGRIKAFLDVTDPEPLPEGHPLWSFPNAIITPHVGGGAQHWRQRAYQLVRQQVLRYVAGEPLVNVVQGSY